MVTPCKGRQGEMRAASSSRKGLLNLWNLLFKHQSGFCSTKGSLLYIPGDTRLPSFPNSHMLPWVRGGDLPPLEKAKGSGYTVGRAWALVLFVCLGFFFLFLSKHGLWRRPTWVLTLILTLVPLLDLSDYRPGSSAVHGRTIRQHYSHTKIGRRYLWWLNTTEVNF